MHSLAAIATAFLLPILTDGYKTFETVCSKPSDVVNYVSSADTRSTLDILWSCLLTIIACTWSVQHLNVPEQREGRDPGTVGNIKWVLKRCRKSTKWMLINIIAPEILLMKSWNELSLTKFNRPRLAEFAVTDGVPWTLTHTLFADMGGFVIRSYSTERLASAKNFDTTPKVLKSKYANPFHLVVSDIHQLRESGVLARLPYITEDELQDKSKGDNFVRAVSILQISWMAVQIIARGIRHLDVSQLEIGVTAFSACAIIIYIVNWSKPKGVQTPITILDYEGEIPDTVLACIGPKAGEISITGHVSPRGSHIANFHSLQSLAVHDAGEGILKGLIGSVVFGCIHFAAWNFKFPTHIEQIIWRCSAMICTFILILFIIGSLINISVFGESVAKDINSYLLLLCLVIYVLARLYLLIELFRTLCFLPPSAYIATWASNVPHLS